MSSLNKASILGRLGRDPESRTTQSGAKIVSLSVATEDSWRDKNSGEVQKRTEWHRVVIMNDGLADVAERFLKKGSLVYLEGKIQTRKWTDQGGQERYTTEIMLGRFDAKLVLCGDSPGSRDDGAGAAAPRAGRGNGASTSGWDAGGHGGELDDEIPF